MSNILNESRYIEDFDELIETTYIECKFTIETHAAEGGDFAANKNGVVRDKRITFEGYASYDLYKALMDAVRKAVD